MIRVLHLLDVEPDYQSETGARQLAGDTSGTFQAQLRRLGRGGDDSTLLRAILSLRRESGGFDLVHAWGQRALTVAALAARTPIVYSPDPSPTRHAIRFARAVMGVRDIHIIAPTDTIRRAYVTRGVLIERCHLIRPGVEFARINRRRDPELRKALGFDPDDFVLLACGESTRESAHSLAVWAASILHLVEPHYRLLLWGRGDHTEQAHRFAIRTHQHGLLEIAQRELHRKVQFEELFPAADAVLVTATEPVPTLPISISMAAGLPIVAVVSPTASELLEDRHTCLMVTRPKPRLIAQRVLDLKADPGLQWSICDMARTEAYEFFSLTRMLEQYRTVYRQVASGQKVDLPHPAAGAGLRFHGRA